MEEYLQYIPVVISIASTVTAATPTPRDDHWFAMVYKIVEIFGLNVGRAKDSGREH
jgi:hypothetical protein